MKQQTGNPLGKRDYVPFNIALLDPAVLREEVEIEVAIGNLENHLRIPTVDKGSVLAEIMEIPNCLGFVFASTILSCSLY